MTLLLSPRTANRWVEKLKEHLRDPTFLQRTIRQYFLENPHKVILVMTGDPEHAQKESAAEQSALEEMEKELTDTKIAHVSSSNDPYTRPKN
jgi:Zn-dependent M16 (insulinase) family peptidase